MLVQTVTEMLMANKHVCEGVVELDPDESVRSGDGIVFGPLQIDELKSEN